MPTNASPTTTQSKHPRSYNAVPFLPTVAALSPKLLYVVLPAQTNYKLAAPCLISETRQPPQQVRTVGLRILLCHVSVSTQRRWRVFRKTELSSTGCLLSLKCFVYAGSIKKAKSKLTDIGIIILYRELSQSKLCFKPSVTE